MQRAGAIDRGREGSAYFSHDGRRTESGRLFEVQRQEVGVETEISCKEGGCVTGYRGNKMEEVQQRGEGCGGVEVDYVTGGRGRKWWEVQQDGGMIGSTITRGTKAGVMGRGGEINGRNEGHTGTGQV